MSTTGVVLIIGIVIVGLWLGPLALIWALNTLFGLGIEYTIKTWAAALIIGGMFSASASRSSP